MRLRHASVVLGAAALAASAFLVIHTPKAPSHASTAHEAGTTGDATPATGEARNPCFEMHRSVCQKRGITHDPTGAVKPDVQGELQALRAYEQIIREHPDWSSERVDRELANQIYTAKRRGRLESAYRWVQKALERFVERQPESVFTAGEKRQLLSRIKRTELQLPTPTPASAYADEPDLLTKNQVFYERTLSGKLRMRVGGAYLLSAKSWFNLVFTVAHEFAHAIDPCELRAARIYVPSYDRLSACFMAQGLIAARATRRECGENDQLSETFADWMAVQVVSEALRNFATEFSGTQLVNAATNAVRDLCEQDDDDGELNLEFHPSPEIRIDHIFARNPMIREVLSCGPVRAPAGQAAEYCGFDFKPENSPRTPRTSSP